MSPTPHDAVPHQFPFRLAERAERCGERRVALVLGTMNGLLSIGNGWPVTLAAEALAQSVLLVCAPPDGAAPRLVGINQMRLLQRVGAGDRLEVQVNEVAAFGSMRRLECRAMKAGALAACAEITVSA